MPDPATLALAAAVATGAVSKIAEVVSQATIDDFKSFRKTLFRHFRGVPEAQEALDEARVEPDDEDAIASVADHIERAAAADPDIRRLVDALTAQASQEGGGAVHNSIRGDVSGGAKVIQTRDIHGSVNL
ncbi:hypothetical protein BJF83_05275 [Nocardiopsis sp. CNR-923]|uniref:hypothetical protein n=1 Tax=Nocardiopsis sp. CNR-923 TaxID=1904965 RepID=UPI00095A2B67|nr:hypothetical protein [Nocardiopsis sp. CNR-923]OLT25574.1 hypothetical protein BJF83_05275 [Nocardiopsis sp. CNR-923]